MKKQKQKEPPLYVSKADRKVGNVIAVVRINRGPFTQKEYDTLAKIFKKFGLLEDVNLVPFHDDDLKELN